ncbi:vascular non-inflammatory molecule 2 [Galendromus occidentalis]|uniref:Vascular non-inflammatory molecule 2 n=1 Tax=Galendromus occidentalis TaxID=34638 RepID=A0AAJ6QS09_9ACAR|nr:vascular non-inflammatory molecule 2 [Galendromus occidentalis]
MKVCVLEQGVKFPSTTPPEETLQDTLHLYEETAKFAKEQGCQLLVCPEMGALTGIAPQDRFVTAEVLPRIGQAPDPSNQATLCALAEIARQNELHLVVSTIEKADAFYNTTVILTPQGTLAGRHRKKHLYLEPCITPSGEEARRIHLEGIGDVEFITCFDVYFAEANREEPSDLAIMVAHWYDEIPNLTLLSVARGWSVSNQTPIIVSNCRSVRQATLGAGLFHPNGNGKYSMSFSKDKECVHIFDLDEKATLIREPKDVLTPDTYQPIIGDLKRFDRLVLRDKSGILKIDLPTISCQIMYELRGLSQDVIYFMMAADGIRRFGNGDSLYLQELYIVALNKQSREVSVVSGNPFRTLRLSMGIKNENQRRTVFPIVVGDNLSLIGPERWQFDHEVLELQVEGAIVCAGMCRRVFNKDVPVVSRKRSRTM